MKWRAPKRHKFGDGWIISTLSGEPAFSDGHAMFIGKRKGSVAKNPELFEKALAQIKIKTKRRLKPGKRELRGTIPVIYLGEFLVQEIFYDHARRIKNVEFFAGRKRSGVICKVGEKVVGAIMSMRTR